MFGALAVMLLAMAGLSLLAVRLPRRQSRQPPMPLDTEQIKGFVYVGAAGLGILAVAVAIVGVTVRGRGLAEALAVLGFFGYAAYLGVAYLMTTVPDARSLLRSRSASQVPAHRQTRSNRTGGGSGGPGTDQA